MEDRTRGLLPRYHDGELTEEATRAVELHLATCAACRAELQALRSLSATLAGAAEPGSTADAEAFWQALQPKLGAQHAAPPWRSWLPGLLLLGLQGILGAIGALLMIGSLVRGLTGINTGLPGLPLPGLFSIGMFGWAGVLYLIWLAAWWSRHHTAPNPSYA
jgi:anti-sigma factor RsiW